MSDTFTKNRLEWLERISANKAVSTSAFKLAFVISGHINRKTGDAWPGLDNLARSLGVDEKTIRRLVNQLVASGYLKKRRGGNGKSNRYRMLSPGGTNMSVPGADRLDNSRSFDRTFDDQPPGQDCPPNSLNEPSEELFEKSNTNTSLESEFMKVWRHYPRKVSRGQAEKAFKTARMTVDFATILAGVLRYAAERSAENPKYTKHFATWLNGKCWADEPAISRHSSPDSFRAGPKIRAGDISRQLIAATDDELPLIDGKSRS